jgi:hypothetical protein
MEVLQHGQLRTPMIETRRQIHLRLWMPNSNGFEMQAARRLPNLIATNHF